MASEGLAIEITCRVLEVPVSSFYARRNRAPSARAIRHAWLTDVIREIHIMSRATYGVRRVHAELVLGRGITIGHNAVELLMRRTGLRGLGGRPRYRKLASVVTASDLVERRFARSGPDQLWVTDITEHPTLRGQGVLCGGARVPSRGASGDGRSTRLPRPPS